MPVWAAERSQGTASVKKSNAAKERNDRKKRGENMKTHTKPSLPPATCTVLNVIRLLSGCVAYITVAWTSRCGRTTIARQARVVAALNKIGTFWALQILVLGFLCNCSEASPIQMTYSETLSGFTLTVNAGAITESQEHVIRLSDLNAQFWGGTLTLSEYDQASFLGLPKSDSAQVHGLFNHLILSFVVDTQPLAPNASRGHVHEWFGPGAPAPGMEPVLVAPCEFDHCRLGHRILVSDGTELGFRFSGIDLFDENRTFTTDPSNPTQITGYTVSIIGHHERSAREIVPYTGPLPLELHFAVPETSSNFINIGCAILGLFGYDWLSRRRNAARKGA